MNYGTEQIYVCSHGVRVVSGGDPNEWVHMPARPGQPARDTCYDPPSTFKVVRATLMA
jgi:hypothetical protein